MKTYRPRNGLYHTRACHTTPVPVTTAAFCRPFSITLDEIISSHGIVCVGRFKRTAWRTAVSCHLLKSCRRLVVPKNGGVNGQQTAQTDAKRACASDVTSLTIGGSGGTHSARDLRHGRDTGRVPSAWRLSAHALPPLDIREASGCS
ncbi:hypothetical protein DPEC_G00202410 [Dallia pectoralis]|uniref:Uncharacterized protein n=1 Tax=Dallia pectoralis TaxID=75939 RepID=A0ACC2G9A5_DALPE|nr:hypothetical protein DPEC_G00202410 [Dallia pectoralis]